MGMIVKFPMVFLWSIVFLTTVYFCAAINYSDKVDLKNLCNEDNYSPQNMLDTELVYLLSKLNELRLSNKVANSTTKSNDLKWIDSCTGWVMVEMKSRSFQKKLQNTQEK
jgi:hypothetical protein